MAIDRDEVRRIAELARLEIPEDAIDGMAVQLSRVLDFAGTLNELDLAGCEPAVLAPPDGAERSDAPGTRTLEPGRATAGSPESDEDFFLVPPVVENLEP
jgi:aspartyl-tRNA(Asn)/glutamyl-tRNA(Gln) amidotransferase subunit C